MSTLSLRILSLISLNKIPAVLAGCASGTHSLPILIVLLFLEVVFLPILIEKPPLKWLRRVEKAFLRCKSLLILEHFLVCLLHDPQFMDIYLDFVLEVFKATENRKTIPNLNILIEQPTSELVLSVSGLPTRIIEIVEPQDAGHHARAVIDSEKVLVVLLDVVDDGACNRDLG